VKIRAQVTNHSGQHEVQLQTGEHRQSLTVPAKPSGGSGVNGGEFLFLALATCYCNDIYREAAARGIQVAAVEVEVDGEFGGPGEPARGVHYRARVQAEASQQEILDLMRHTDTVAEIQNTLRRAIPVELANLQPVSTQPQG
jgi:organic hydroperoxide reductase OsmC/OhrA